MSVPGETVDISLNVDGLKGVTIEAVSEHTFDIKPIITNAETADVYVFLEIDVPMLDYAPVFTYIADEVAWSFVNTETADGYQKAVYSYGKHVYTGCRSRYLKISAY